MHAAQLICEVLQNAVTRGSGPIASLVLLPVHLDGYQARLQLTALLMFQGLQRCPKR